MVSAKKTAVVWTILAGTLTLTAGRPAGASVPKDCPSAREYIATLEYLRANRDLSVAEEQARQIASQISQHCVGSAGRFVRVTQLLLQAELPGSTAVQAGLEAATKSDDQASAFLSIFRRAYSADQLDLTAADALATAKSLSLQFDGMRSAVQDYEKLVDFCVKPGALDLSKPQCNQFASRVALSSAGFNEKPGKVFERFMKSFQFIRSKSGPELPTGDALKTAELVTAQGPLGFENFSSAFRYATNPRGLSFNRAQALEFALTLAKHSSQQQAPSEPQSR